MESSPSSELSILQALFQREQRDPQTTLEFVSPGEGVLCGVQEVMRLVRSVHTSPFQLWALDEGATFTHDEVVIRWRGHFLQAAASIPALTGILGVSSGWATAAHALVECAKPIPVIVAEAQTLYPNTFAGFAYAARIGGCLAFDSPPALGLVSRNFILLMGDTLRAAQSFDQALDPELPRLVRVDTYHDDADEAVRVALALGDKLTGVVLDAEKERNQVSADLLKRVRGQLDLAGFPRVKIYVGGNVTIETVTYWKEEGAPVDGLFAGETLALAPPIHFDAELKESDGKPVARRGLTPGTTPNLRLKKIELE